MLRKKLTIVPKFYSTSGVASTSLSVNKPLNPQKVIKKKNSDAWDIFAGVVLMRTPVIAPAKTELEDKWSHHTSQYDVERSLKSDFDLELEKEAKYVLCGR